MMEHPCPPFESARYPPIGASSKYVLIVMGIVTLGLTALSLFFEFLSLVVSIGGMGKRNCSTSMRTRTSQPGIRRPCC